MEKWIKVSEQLPPENVIAQTKIDDGKFCRNRCRLYRCGNLWFLPDGSMYVYYTPTHWRSVFEKGREKTNWTSRCRESAF